LLQGEDSSARIAALEKQIAKIDTERKQLANAIATGGQLETLLEALRAREKQFATCESDRAALRSATVLRASDVDRVRDELLTIAGEWRHVLADDPTNARPIVSSLLKGRLTITPTTKNRWTMSGEGTLAELFRLEIFQSGWRPQRDTQICTR
jgi:hypothetical protein